MGLESATPSLMGLESATPSLMGLESATPSLMGLESAILSPMELVLASYLMVVVLAIDAKEEASASHSVLVVELGQSVEAFRLEIRLEILLGILKVVLLGPQLDHLWDHWLDRKLVHESDQLLGHLLVPL